MRGEASIQLVEVFDTHSEVGIGEEFDGLGFCAALEQLGGVFLMVTCMSRLAKASGESDFSPTMMLQG